MFSSTILMSQLVKLFNSCLDKNISGSLVEWLDQRTGQRPEYRPQSQFSRPDLHVLPEPPQSALPHWPHSNPWCILVQQSKGTVCFNQLDGDINLMGQLNSQNTAILHFGCRWHQRPMQWWSGSGHCPSSSLPASMVGNWWSPTPLTSLETCMRRGCSHPLLMSR